MRLTLASGDSVPYLDDSHAQEYADVIVKSEDGIDFRFNKLFFVALMTMGAENKSLWSTNKLNPDLLDHWTIDQEIVISTNYTYQDLKIICDFIMQGILPCPIEDIFSGKMAGNLMEIFHSFGLDLTSILADNNKEKDVEVQNKPTDNDEATQSHKRILNENIDVSEPKRIKICFGLPPILADSKKEKVVELQNKPADDEDTNSQERILNENFDVSEPKYIKIEENTSDSELHEVFEEVFKTEENWNENDTSEDESDSETDEDVELPEKKDTSA